MPHGKKVKFLEKTLTILPTATARPFSLYNRSIRPPEARIVAGATSGAFV